MHMVMFVLDDPNKLDAVLDAWRSMGVSVVTVVESTGVQPCETRRVCGRYLFGLPGLVESTQQCQYTLFAVVPDSQVVSGCLEAVERVVGDLAEPDAGALVAWELALVKGAAAECSEAGLRDGLA